MEHDLHAELFRAIGEANPDRVKAILDKDPNAVAATQSGETALYSAYRRWLLPESRDDQNRARTVFMALLAACETIKAQGSLPKELLKDLATLLVQAVRLRDGVLSKALLQAGADPNGIAPVSGDTPLFMAILNDDVEAVMLLIEHGVDLNAPLGLYSNAMALAGRVSRRVFWHLLFRDMLGNVPEGLVETFVKGSLNAGAERDAIADLNLSEEAALSLWLAMLKYETYYAAAATIMGYCASAGIDLEGNAGALFLVRLLNITFGSTHAQSRNWGGKATRALKQLTRVGVRFENISSEAADGVLGALINLNDEQTACKLVALGLRPDMTEAVQPDQPFSCPILDLAVQKQLPMLVAAILGFPDVPGTVQIGLMHQFIEDDNLIMLEPVCSNIELDGNTQIELISVTVRKRRRRCLAILVQNCCSPSLELQFNEPTEQNYAGFSLFQALALQEGEDPALPDRFDCACLLLLNLAPQGPRLRRLCEFIILNRALAGDGHAVYFLCSHGFTPLLLLNRFRAVWASDDASDEDKSLLVQGVVHACKGLTAFIKHVLDWNLKQYALKSIEVLAPGLETLQIRELLRQLLTSTPADAVAWPAPNPDPRLILILCEILEQKTAGFPEEARKAVKETLGAIIALLKRQTEPPSLAEIAATAVIDDTADEDYETVRQHLEQVIYTTVVDDLLSPPGENFLLLQLLILQWLRNEPELMPYFFTADDESESSDYSSDSDDSG